MIIRHVCLVILTALCVSCSHLQPQPPDPTPAPPAPPVVIEADNNTFLWKPKSDSRIGNPAAILIPARIKADDIRVNDQPPTERRGPTNGNRPTFFMDRQGAEFGQNILVISYAANQETGRWLIPDGAQKYERK